jgi:hypothetical protein
MFLITAERTSRSIPSQAVIKEVLSPIARELELLEILRHVLQVGTKRFILILKTGFKTP